MANPTDLALQRKLIGISPPGVRLSAADLLRAPVAVVMELALQEIFTRLSPADLLRAALACKSWRRAAVHALPRAPPLLGHFFQPKAHPAVFVPHDAATFSSRLLSVDFIPYDNRNLTIYDVYLGIVLLLPCLRHQPETFLTLFYHFDMEPYGRPWSVFPGLVAVDPASRRQAMVSGKNPLRDGEFFIGAAVLVRTHPSNLTFKAVYLTEYNDRPCAWTASFVDGKFLSWRQWPETEGIVLDFDPSFLERRCVHAAGVLYWSVAASIRVLRLDPTTLEFSYLTVPHDLDGPFGVSPYRIGESHVDGRLCLATLTDDQILQIWVGAGGGEGWYLETEVLMSRLFDAVPDLPKDDIERMRSIKLTNLDYHSGSGKVLFMINGYEPYSFHMNTGKLQRLLLEDGNEYGEEDGQGDGQGYGQDYHQPIHSYSLMWPPVFLSGTD